MGGTTVEVPNVAGVEIVLPVENENNCFIVWYLRA
jgi:hypothetical protein